MTVAVTAISALAPALPELICRMPVPVPPIVGSGPVNDPDSTVTPHDTPDVNALPFSGLRVKDDVTGRGDVSTPALE